MNKHLAYPCGGTWKMLVFLLTLLYLLVDFEGFSVADTLTVVISMQCFLGQEELSSVLIRSFSSCFIAWNAYLCNRAPIYTSLMSHLPYTGSHTLPFLILCLWHQQLSVKEMLNKFASIQCKICLSIVIMLREQECVKIEPFTYSIGSIKKNGYHNIW